jgi:small subunit ribosomal protein S20
MANIKSAKKRIRQTISRTKINIARKSRIKTFLRLTEIQISSGNHQGAMDSLKNTQKEIMVGVSKGVWRKKTASRKISRLNTRIRFLSKG